MSIALSRSRSCHWVANGGRYLTWYSPAAPVVSCRLAEPFGHSRPPLTGEPGSPSIWVTRPSLTYTILPPPTSQYTHTDFTTRSSTATRGRRSLVPALFSAAPSPR